MTVMVQSDGPLVATVVVTFNGATWIEQCLASLANSTLPTHVVVVDNRSTDDTVLLVQANHPNVELIRNSVNAGFGIGNNIGIARALDQGFEYVFLLNQDAFVTPDALHCMVQFMKEHNEFGIVSPLHCSPDLHTIDGKTYERYLRTYAKSWLCDAALGRARPHYRIRGINAAAWMVRSSVFAQCGGFDPLFFMYGEDDDLINRLETHDVSFGLLPDARVVHHRQSPPARPAKGWLESVRRRALRVRSDLLLQIKNPKYSRKHMVLQLFAQGIAGPLVEFVVKRDGTALFASLTAAVGLLPDIERVHASASRCATPGRHFLSGASDEQAARTRQG